MRRKFPRSRVMIDDNTTKTSLFNSPGSPVHAIKMYPHEGLEPSIVQLINQSNRCVYPAYQHFQFNSLFTQNTRSLVHELHYNYIQITLVYRWSQKRRSKIRVNFVKKR